MLTDVKHIKKVCCVPRLCTLTNATYEQTADLSLYTWYTYAWLRDVLEKSQYLPYELTKRKFIVRSEQFGYAIYDFTALRLVVVVHWKIL